MSLKSCKFCKKKYQAKIGELNRGKGKFCSINCFHLSIRKIDLLRLCLGCNSEMRITQLKEKNKKFCNKSCITIYAKSSFKKICKFCNDFIPYRLSGNQRECCSIKCAARLRVLRKGLVKCE